MTPYYTSLLAAILIGIAGQIALKSGANGSTGIAAQFLNVSTIIGLALYVVAALCYVVSLKKFLCRLRFRPWLPAMRWWRFSRMYCGTSRSAGRRWPGSR